MRCLSRVGLFAVMQSKVVPATLPTVNAANATTMLHIHPMLLDVARTALAELAFAVCFFAPGYVVATVTDVMGFRARSLAERALWAVALSGPVSTVLTCIVARVLPQSVLLGIFVALTVITAWLLALDMRRTVSRRRAPLGGAFWTMAGVAFLIGLYTLLATLPIETAHALHESSVITDWCIRLPLVQAAVRGGLPPNNPLFAVAGHAPPMRYYYFWYELCALLVRLTHLTARCVFTASTAWSAYSVLAVLFLFLKYLGCVESVPALWRTTGTATASPARLRRVCVAAAGLACLPGLTLLPNLVYLLQRPVKVLPHLESWQGDRMPNWLGTMLLSPHHIAGVAYGCLGFLLLAVLPTRRRQQAVQCALAAVCFAVLIGTSTYLGICFALAGLGMAALRVRRRQWDALAVMAFCALLAVAIDVPFLREMTANSGYTAAEHLKPNETKALVGNHMFKIVLSNWHAAYGAIGNLSHALGMHLDEGRLRYILPFFVLPWFYLVEFSFYVFVIVYQVRLDFGRGRRTTEKAWMLWALFAGFLLPMLFLNSEPTQGINDVELHCGLAIRLVLLVWAAPMFANVAELRRAKAVPSLSGKLVIAATVAMVVIGVGGAVWEVVIGRIYMPLITSGAVHTSLGYGLDAPFLQVRRANDAAAGSLPEDAIVQSNPEGQSQQIFQFYMQRQTAAGDVTCEAAFGGDVQRCITEVSTPLHRLFGGTTAYRELGPDEAPPEPANPAYMTHEAFTNTCARLHLDALIATRSDTAWGLPDTWVWREPTLYADDATRVVPCPRPPA